MSEAGGMAAGTRRMTLTRIIVLLAVGLTTLLAVITLRAETTRVHFQVAELERRSDVLRAQVRREELALERARRPQVLLERVRDARLSESAPPAGGKSAATSPDQPRRGPARSP